MYFIVSDPSAQKRLMQWLFEIVADISKQKFKNLTFACGHLCPYVSCLKRAVRKEGHIDDQHELRVFDYEDCKKLRSGGLPAVKCLHKLRLSAAQENQDGVRTPLITSINVVLSVARNKGHIEEMFSYSNGDSNHHDVMPCLFSDPNEVALQLPADLNEVSDFQEQVRAAFEQASHEQSQSTVHHSSNP